MTGRTAPEDPATAVPVAAGDPPVTVTETAGTPLRWALVGYGTGGRVFHAPLIRSALEFELVAVVTTSAERSALARQQMPGVVTVPDLDGLAELGVEGVTISTPPATHAPLARQALRRGFDVVLDKPFALTAVEALDLVGAAEQSRRTAGGPSIGRSPLVVPYFNRRWDDDFRTLTRLVAEGVLGTVHRLTSRLDRSHPVKGGWYSDPNAGGGTLLDLGPHLIDQALALLGPAVTVFAELDARRKAAAEDDILLLLQHESGARSTLAASLAAPAAGPRFLVQGDRAGVRIEGFDVQEAQLKAGSSPRDLGDAWGADPQRSALIAPVDGAPATTPLDRGRWDRFYPALAAALREAGSLPVEPRDAVAVAQVIDAARESARRGRAIRLHGR